MLLPTEMTPPQRGRLYMADMSPRFGTEPGKARPVLVVQTDLLNRSILRPWSCP